MLKKLLGKLSNLIMGGVFALFKNKIIKAIIRALKDKLLPELKVRAYQLGQKFSVALIKMARKLKLSEDECRRIEAAGREVTESFWSGAESD